MRKLLSPCLIFGFHKHLINFRMLCIVKHLLWIASYKQILPLCLLRSYSHVHFALKFVVNKGFLVTGGTPGMQVKPFIYAGKCTLTPMAARSSRDFSFASFAMCFPVVADSPGQIFSCMKSSHTSVDCLQSGNFFINNMEVFLNLSSNQCSL